MSDTSQGPGWWLASDGKWYPPDLRAGSRTLVRPAGAESSQGPAWWQASDGKWYPPTLHPDVLVTEGPPEPVATPVDEGRVRRRPRWPHRVVLAAVAALVALAAAVGLVVGLGGSGGTPSTSAGELRDNTGWTLSTLHVVGGPLVAPRRVLVLSTGPDGAMSLTAVAPATGGIAWQRPFSPSDVPPDVPLAPVVSGDVALVLAPTEGATADAVTVEGVDVRTGARVWAEPVAVPVIDAPTQCTAAKLFCVVATGPGGPALVALSPATGAILGTVTGPVRALAPGLYVTAANPPELLAVSSGRAAWHVPVPTVFGAAPVGAQYGARFTTAGQVLVGSLGPAPQGPNVAPGAVQTVGIRETDGSVAWRRPGAFDCLGAIALAPPVVCRYPGPASAASGTPSTEPPLTLQGIDPATGTVRWSQDVADDASLAPGGGVPVADATHVAVTRPGGRRALLDLTSGRLGAVPVGTALWCGGPQEVAVRGPSAALAGGRRAGVASYAACTATGAAGRTDRLRPVAGIGVRTGGLFVWASPAGLTARAVG